MELIEKDKVFRILCALHLGYTNRTDEYKEGYNKALSDAMKHLRE